MFVVSNSLSLLTKGNCCLLYLALEMALWAAQRVLVLARCHTRETLMNFCRLYVVRISTCECSHRSWRMQNSMAHESALLSKATRGPRGYLVSIDVGRLIRSEQWNRVYLKFFGLLFKRDSDIDGSFCFALKSCGIRNLLICRLFSIFLLFSTWTNPEVKGILNLSFRGPTSSAAQPRWP